MLWPRGRLWRFTGSASRLSSGIGRLVRKLDFHPTAPVLCGVLPADSRPRTASSQHFLYTQTYSSWLNQVERWFDLITQQAIRRGSFSSVKDLIARIDSF